jgi:hypothetical protein
MTRASSAKTQNPLGDKTMPDYTNAEAQTIQSAYRNLYWMVDHTMLTHDLDEAMREAKAIGSQSRPASIREREANVMQAFLRGFKAPRKLTAADMHGMCRWWQIAVMAGANFRTQYHVSMTKDARTDDATIARRKRQVREAAKTRRMMREAVEAHTAARDRFIKRIMA